MPPSSYLSSLNLRDVCLKLVVLSAGDVASLAECLACLKLWVQFPALHKLGMVVRGYNSGTWEVEAEGLECQETPYQNINRNSCL